MPANILQKADSHISTLETISGEEGARGRHAIYSMHIPRTRSSIYSHGSEVYWSLCECVGELHNRKAL